MNMKKVLALALALVLIVGATVAGTVAWLMDTTSDVKNTFTTSDIGVELKENTNTYKMIPGHTIAKDPKAKITSGSEDALLFIKVVENGGNVTVGSTTYNFDSFIKYAIATDWNELDATNHPGVYYMVIDDETEKNVDYSILAAGSYTYDGVPYTWDENEVLTKPEVTKEMMNALTDETKPTLTFTAYAHQLVKNAEGDIFIAAEAWANLNP